MNKNIKPLVYVGLAFFVVMMVLTIGAYYHDKNRDYSPEIAIARNLIAGATVSGEFDGFRQTACSSGTSTTRFFLKQATAEGLDPEKIKRL